MVTNHRSIFPKLNNLADELIEHEMHLGLHSETWENMDKNSHANAIEELLEIQGINYISTPRPGRRGGGVAITLLCDSPFSLTKLDHYSLPGDKSLEVCWGLVKPKNPTGHIKTIIVCAFYSPPNSKKKSALAKHISLSYFALKSQFPDAVFVCGGDKNDLNINLLLNIDPSFRQIVSKPTYKQAILDVIVTDIGHYFHDPSIRPAVEPDNPMVASASDHSIVFAKVNTNASQPPIREMTSHVTRPLPSEALAGFAGWVQQESWEYVYNGCNTSDMVNRFNHLVNVNLDYYCPTKTIKRSNLDGHICSAAVKQVCRRKNREYLKHGNTARYKALKKEVKMKLKQAAASFLEKQVNLVSSSNNSWLKHVKSLASRPGDKPSKSFTLPQHIEDNLTALESANRICEFFSSIGQEYSPLSPSSLVHMSEPSLSRIPAITPILLTMLSTRHLRKVRKPVVCQEMFPQRS